MKIQDEHYKKSKGSGSYVEHKTVTDTNYKRGHFYHPKGIVEVYEDGFISNVIHLTFIYNGTIYTRLIWRSKSISDKALNTRSNQFVSSLFI